MGEAQAMDYQVRFVSEDALPAGVDYAFARQAGSTYLFMKTSAIGQASGRCDALTRAWETWQAAEAQPNSRGARSFPASASA